MLKGADDVLREEALSALVDSLVGDGDRSLAVDEFAGGDVEVGAAIDAAQTLPFLTDKRIVGVRHAARFGNAEVQAPLLGYLAEPVDTTDLVLVWEKSPEAGSKLNAISPKLKAALKAAGATEHDSQPPARDRERWVGEQFAEHGLSLDARGKQLVADRLGENAGAVVELIERLAGLFGDQTKLTADEIEPLLGEAGGVPPWELTDAIDKGDAATALDRLQRMMRGGDRHPLVIMSTLQTHYGRMMRLDGARVRSEK